MSDIFTEVKRQVDPTLDYLIGTSALGVSAMYKKYTGQTFNAVTKVAVDSYSDTALSGIKSFHTFNSAVVARNSAANSEIQAGDVLYIFKFNDMPTGVSLKDRLVEGGKTYNIKSIMPIAGIVYMITVEKGS
jgi:hypothetical protein